MPHDAVIVHEVKAEILEIDNVGGAPFRGDTHRQCLMLRIGYHAAGWRAVNTEDSVDAVCNVGLDN
jgi:hypothetical protein